MLEFRPVCFIIDQRYMTSLYYDWCNIDTTKNSEQTDPPPQSNYMMSDTWAVWNKAFWSIDWSNKLFKRVFNAYIISHSKVHFYYSLYV